MRERSKRVSETWGLEDGAGPFSYTSSGYLTVQDINSMFVGWRSKVAGRHLAVRAPLQSSRGLIERVVWVLPFSLTEEQRRAIATNVIRELATALEQELSPT